MSDQRAGGIAWTEQTWNPVRGCSRVSAGCTSCYAEKVAGRFSGINPKTGKPLAYHGLARMAKNGEARWTGEVRMVPEHLTDPLRWTRPRMVFVNSMSDLFHEKLTFEQIDQVFAVMALAGKHVFQVLTKRAARMREYMDSRSMSVEFWEKAARDLGYTLKFDNPVTGCTVGLCPFPLLNVWLGVSAEDQKTADERVAELLLTHAAIRWVSYEPALGPLNGARFIRPRATVLGYRDVSRRMGLKGRLPSHLGAPGIDWIVAGGESGDDARPFDLAWARALRDQCQAARVAFFFKQTGENVREKLPEAILVNGPSLPGIAMGGAITERRLRVKGKGGDLADIPADLRIREWPVHADREMANP